MTGSATSEAEKLAPEANPPSNPPPPSLPQAQPPPSHPRSAKPAPHSCVHCRATETPLWRAGPLGPKTLCNACGVRWKKTGSVIPRSRRSSSSTSSRAISKPRRPAASSSASTSSSTPASKPKLPLPAPVAVRVHETRASNGNYESVFAGLMVVPRGGRIRTRTPRAQLFFDGVRPAPTASPSPPPIPGGSKSVYVTETLAPSPSPSPPPIPRMEPFPEGQGFRMVMHVKKKDPNGE